MSVEIPELDATVRNFFEDRGVKVSWASRHPLSVP